jgi:glycosyltransferase involved in cell wall biosynthesis
MTNVYIDLTALCGRNWTGVEYFALYFSQTLSAGFKNLNVINLVVKGGASAQNNTLPSGLRYQSIGKNIHRLVTEYFLLPFFVLCKKPAQVIFPCFPPAKIIWRLKSKKTKIITLIHDVVPWRYPQTMSALGRLILAPRYKKALFKSEIVLTVSQTEKNALLNINSNAKIFCVYTPVYLLKPDKSSGILEKLSIAPGQYILSVSTIEPRKNFCYTFLVLKDFLKKQSGIKIVVTGRSGWGNVVELSGAERGDIVFTGYVSGEELADLYKNALFYITLPLHEGFGKTPVEALLYGTPAVVSDIPVYREILDGKGVLFLPLDNVHAAVQLLDENIDTLKNMTINTDYYKKFTEENYYKLIPPEIFL